MSFEEPAQNDLNHDVQVSSLVEARFLPLSDAMRALYEKYGVEYGDMENFLSKKPTNEDIRAMDRILRKVCDVLERISRLQ